MKCTPLGMLLLTALLAGCSGLGGLSTGSIFGGDEKKPAVTAAPQSAAPFKGDPTSRALQVGSTSARAVKCGYNFDPAKLKASFIASEIGQGLSTADVPRVEEIYDVAYRGVTKAAAEDPKYCTAKRTKEIKADLNRHLNGNFAPKPPKKVAQDDGLFSGWGKSNKKNQGVKIKLPSDNSDN